MKNTLIRLSIILLIMCFVACENKSKPEALSKEKVFELSERCSNAGKKYFNDYWASTNRQGRYSWDDPEYHYNQRLNTCLIHIRYIEFGAESNLSTHYNQVIDIFSNKTILYGWFNRDVKAKSETLVDIGGSVPNVTSIEYFKRKDKLFSE